LLEESFVSFKSDAHARHAVGLVQEVVRQVFEVFAYEHLAKNRCWSASFI